MPKKEKEKETETRLNPPDLTKSITVAEMIIPLPSELFVSPERTFGTELRKSWKYLTSCKPTKYVKLGRKITRTLWSNERKKLFNLEVIIAQQLREQNTNPYIPLLLHKETQELLNEINEYEKKKYKERKEHKEYQARVPDEVNLQEFEDDYQNRKIKLLGRLDEKIEEKMKKFQLTIMTDIQERALADMELEYARMKTEKHLNDRNTIQVVSLILALLLAVVTVLKSLSIGIIDIYDVTNINLKNSFSDGFNVVIGVLTGINFILISTHSALLAMNNHESREQERSSNSKENKLNEQREKILKEITDTTTFDFDELEENIILNRP